MELNVSLKLLAAVLVSKTLTGTEPPVFASKDLLTLTVDVSVKVLL